MKINKYLIIVLLILLKFSNAVAKTDMKLRAYIDTGIHSYGNIVLFNSNNPNQIYSISNSDNSLRAWDVNRGISLKSVFFDSMQNDTLVGLCETSTEIYVFQSRGKGITRVYQLDAEKIQEISFKNLTVGTSSLACNSKYGYAILAEGRNLSLIDLSSLTLIGSGQTSQQVKKIAHHPSQNTFITLGHKGQLEEFSVDRAKFRLNSTLNTTSDEFEAVDIAYSPNGKNLAVSSQTISLKLYSVNPLLDKGSYFTAGGDSLHVLAWRNDKEIISAGKDDPIMRYVNNLGKLSNQRANFEKPIKNVSGLVVVGDKVLVGTNDGSVSMLSGGEFYNDSLSLKSELHSNYANSISFDGIDDFKYQLSIKSKLFTDYENNKKLDSVSQMKLKYAPIFNDMNFILTNRGVVRSLREKLSLSSCNQKLKTDFGEASVVGAKSAPKLLIDKKEFAFKVWPNSDFDATFLSSCVDNSRQYVAFAGNNGVSLYLGSKKLLWNVKPNSPSYYVAISPNNKFVVSLCANGSMEWRDFSSGTLLWTIAHGNNTLWAGLNKNDYNAVIYLPDGYFSGSIDAYKLIKFRVENNINSWHFDGSSLYDVFYRPDVVEAKVNGKDIDTLVGKTTINQVIENPPPLVSIAKIPLITDSKRVTIPYEITPNVGGLAEVRVFQNGKLISSDGSYRDAPGKVGVPFGMKSTDASSARNLKLKEAYNANPQLIRDHLVIRGAQEKNCNPCRGEVAVAVIPGQENTVTLVAFNRDNTIHSVPATVSFRSTLPKEDPQLWVLAVGVNEFKEISSLKNAKKDAIDFVCTYTGQKSKSKISNCSEKGQAQGLFRPENIHVVDVLTDQQATKANIQKSLAEVANKAKPGDTFIWFVASHGMIDGNGLYGIVAHDTQCLQNNCRDNIAGQLTSNEILEASKKIAAMKQLMVFDTCHSGGLDSKLSGLYDARMTILAKNMGLHMYASAQATELAQDGAPNTNGTFTAQLLKGIKGAAPKNNQNQISVMTLGEFAKEQTIEATKSANENAMQTPVIQHFGEDAGLVLIR